MTARASKLCRKPGCPNIRPCPEPGHEPKPWEGSKRRTRTISGWAQQRRAKTALYLHDGVCHVCGRPGATEVDHVIPLAEGGADHIDNLRPIHRHPCHAEKTKAEAERAQRRAR